MRLFYCALILTILNSCSRDPGGVDNKPSEDKPTGIIYSSNRGKITAFDIGAEKVLWQTALSGVLDANAALYDSGTIYTNTQAGVVAIDANGGHIKWQQGDRVRSGGGMPVVRDTLLYSIGSNQPTFGLGSSLYCLSTRTGSVVWSKSLQPGYSSEGAIGSPVVVGDKVIGVGHGGSSGAPSNSIYCFNRFDGSLIWYDGTTVYNTIKPYPFSPDNSQVIFPAGIAGVSTDGLYSFDINTGTFLWHNSAIVISPRQVQIYKDNQITLIAPMVTGTFNLPSKKLEHITTDTINRATVFKDRIFVKKYDFGSNLKCRDLYSNSTIWDIRSPYREVWDTSTNIPNSYTSSLVADEDYLYYAEYIFNGPHPSPDNSLFIFNASTGEIVKEIKLKTTDTPFSKTFFIVKDGIAYYPDMK